jgi:adenosylcobinamide-GDP ribazoletransferase
MDQFPNDRDQDDESTVRAPAPLPTAPGSEFLLTWGGQTLIALRFFSRLPIPVLAFEHDPHGTPDFRILPRVLPVAGALISLPAALMFLVASALGLSATVAAALSIATGLVASGAMHEDGLADVADGFGGGRDKDERLKIMSDSRSGAFGIAALGIMLILRVVTLSDIGEVHGAWGAAAAILAVGALSRFAAVIPMHILPPAKTTGRAASVGQPTFESMAYGALAALLSAAVLLSIAGFSGRAIGEAVILSLASALPLVWLSNRMIEGQTGDVAGAAQQVAEAVALIALLMR